MNIKHFFIKTKMKLVLLKFALYKFLGKFIPYFKKKLMDTNYMLQNIILPLIKNHLSIRYSDAKIHNPRLTPPNKLNDFYIINYDVFYKDLEFKIELNYYSDIGNLDFKFNFKDNTDLNGKKDNVLSVFELFEYFKDSKKILLDKLNESVSM